MPKHPKFEKAEPDTLAAVAETPPPKLVNPIRVITRGAYDLQKLRIATGNRVVGNIKAKMGQAPGQTEEDGLTDDAKKFLTEIKRHFRRITDALIEIKYKGPFPGDELISTFTEYALVAQYVELEKLETEQFKRLEKALQEFPIYTQYLSEIPGVAERMAGVLVSEIDIHKAKYVSSIWMYAGLDVAEDGNGRSKRKEHLIKREYISKKGTVELRDSITYNAWLKTKLLGVLAPSLSIHNKHYKKIYNDYRHRIENDPKRNIVSKPGFNTDDTWTPMRRHRAALRYMVKMFLADLYAEWRKLEGLPVTSTYHEGKLGHKHAA